MRDVDGPYLPLQDKSAYFILSPYYGRNQLIPLARNQDPFFSRNPNNMPLNFLPYAKEVFGILVIVHQFHSDKGYWVGSRYQKSLPKCLLICHVETFEVINQEQSPIKGGLFIVSCTNFMSRYGSFGRINCHFNQSDLQEVGSWAFASRQMTTRRRYRKGNHRHLYPQYPVLFLLSPFRPSPS